MEVYYIVVDWILGIVLIDNQWTNWEGSSYIRLKSIFVWYDWMFLIVLVKSIN